MSDDFVPDVVDVSVCYTVSAEVCAVVECDSSVRSIWSMDVVGVGREEAAEATVSMV